MHINREKKGMQRERSCVQSERSRRAHKSTAHTVVDHSTASDVKASSEAEAQPETETASDAHAEAPPAESHASIVSVLFTSFIIQ